MARYKSPAVRRYLVRLSVLMIAYLALLLVAVRTFRSGADIGVFAWPLAVAPAFPIIGVFWAVMRLLVEEPDEYLRTLFVRQVLIATAFCLTVMTVWEFLQNFDLVPAGTGGFGAAFIWFLGLGVGAIFNRVTDGTSGNCP
ncbi:hypothetical protein G7078_02140 [Sphingomonas sinipercae]|uniref:Uncharacterized protein n=1 Tax=Sphingomonas sinipercae TaxID=2714944 RepID=A0A6G7ZL48_9SPHN|nr:hypothetical protein [Sphingomonas sinipercae]QIL01701.1 hypothetical protein G7078_02140 [Sphingomonas sinipercae]